MALRRSGSISTSDPGALEHVLDDRQRILGAGIVRRHDRDVRALHRDLPHQRALAPVPVSPCAEDDDHAPLAEVARRAQDGLERVRRVGVVDQRGERLPGVDRLEPPGDPRHARDTLPDRLLVEIEQQSGGHGAEHVLDVEDAAERRFDLDSACFEPAPLDRQLERLGSYLSAFLEPERHERRAVGSCELGREPLPPLVPDVHRGRRRLRPREEPSLGLEVLLHRPVEIEVILAQVREDERVEADPVEPSERRAVRRRLDRGAAVSRVDHLAKETMQVDRLRRGERRGALLPADDPAHGPDQPRPASRGVEHRVQEERRRGLPVRPGDSRRARAPRLGSPKKVSAATAIAARTSSTTS